jgi:hypothetical protein
MYVKTLCGILILSVSVFAQSVKVNYLLGEARYKESAQAESWSTLSLSSELGENNVVRTGGHSLCELKFSDGSITKLLENSMLELRNVSRPEERGVEMFSALGKFYFKIKKSLSRSFTVTTPVAVAAVRGTEFIIVHSGNKTDILVKEGEVQFSDPDKRNIVIVKSMQKSSIQSGQMPQDPMPLSANEVEAFGKLQSAETESDEGNNAIPENDLRSGINNTTEPGIAPDVQTEDQDRPKIEEVRPSDNQPGFRAGIAIGAVTIDGKLYNQIGFRPEFSMGKLGVALDLSFYIDQDGNIREENWDSFRDIFEKIYYVRWGLPGDPFYVKVGAIDNYRLGFGLLMNHYSNTIEYPNVIRTGMELGIQGDKMGFQGMLNNFSELTDGGGVSAGRFTYRALGNLQLGVSMVFDQNQYKGLKDRDGDGVPDYLDAFPDKKGFAIDSDKDGKPDIADYDRNGDGFTDNRDYLIATGLDTNLLNDQAYLADPEAWEKKNLDPEPFNINRADDKTQIAFALDASYPLLNFDYLKLITYAQYAKYPYSGGWGITAPGFLAKFAFINLYAEYRIFGEHFLPEYFNTTYELERAVFVSVNEGDSLQYIQPRTKRELLDTITENLKGYMIGADFNLFDFMIFGAEYQNMTRSSFRIETFRSSLDLNTRFIPKISKAGAYYYQNNARDLFKKTEGTVLGYRFGYEIASGATLLLDFRQTYRDRNGDGKISGPDETVKITSIQTVIQL